MSFSQWLFGGIDNPFQAGQWKPLHISVMLSCVALILIFNFIVKRSRNKEKAKQIIVCALVGAIAFFEIMIRFVQCVKLYHLHLPEMEGLTWLWILLPKPWCAISCWALIASVFIKKTFFYNYASLSALLCSAVFFVYPGVGFNNVHLLFENWYSILTHALLLTTSITLITFKIAEFQYKHLWKVAVCIVLTFAYALVEIYILKIQTDPLYFMPGGDIQADILRLDYGVYLSCYIALIVIYINTAHIIGDKETVKKFFAKWKRRNIKEGTL
jgi:hypothetical protein